MDELELRKIKALEDISDRLGRIEELLKSTNRILDSPELVRR